MALKQWMKRCQPLSIYIVLILTMFYFLLQLVVSYITHALTLTIDSYLMLCNLIALFGCIITIKVCSDEESISCGISNCESEHSGKSDPNENSANNQTITCSDPKSPYASLKPTALEKRLKNTFGWARVDVLVMLIGCVVFCSLCFSNVIEALQTLFHISHSDEMHYPVAVFCIGLFGLVLNGLSYLLIGGYTFHHSSCLRVTATGMVVLDGDVVRMNGQRKLNLRTQFKAKEVFRDVIGSIFVMICAASVFFADNNIAKFIDPIISIISAIFLVILNFPYMKDSCCILLQTIPNHINVDSLCKELTDHFPTILNIHDLHIWELTRQKTFLTAHIIFMNPQVYTNVKQDIINFFLEHGISVVTIQPEFFKDSNNVELISSLDSNCLIKCVSSDCYQRYCCDLVDPEALESICVSKLQDSHCDCPETTAKSAESAPQPSVVENVTLPDTQLVRDAENNCEEVNQRPLEESTSVSRTNDGQSVIAIDAERQYLQTDL